LRAPAYLGKFFSYVGVDEALSIVRESLKPLPSEEVDARAAVGRVLAVDVRSMRNLPEGDVAVVDGFAVKAEDLGPNATLRVGERPASGVAVPIRTGQLLPEGVDTVAPLEVSEPLNGYVRIHRVLPRGYGVLRRGSDVRKSQVVFRRGRELRPQDVKLLGELGIPAVKVFRRPRVAVVPTGDEFVTGARAEYSSYSVAEAIKYYGACPERFKPQPDDPVVLKDLVKDLMREYDVVVTIGGASIGVKDFMWEAGRSLGRGSSFRGVKLHPGRVTSFVGVGGRAYVMLPGLFTSTIGGLIYVLIPVVRVLQGLPGRGDYVVVRASFKGSAEFGRFKPFRKLVFVKVSMGEGGVKAVGISKKLPSISIVAMADGFVEVPEGVEALRDGDPTYVRGVRGVFPLELQKLGLN